jgi:hypothetical protein
MLRIAPIALAILLAAVVAPQVSAAGQSYKGIRNNDSVEVSSVRKHRKRVDRSLSRQRPDDESYAGYRTDFAGNPYFYYRPGGVFGPGKGLRAPYPN